MVPNELLEFGTYFEHLNYTQNVPNELLELLEPILNTYIPQSMLKMSKRAHRVARTYFEYLHTAKYALKMHRSQKNIFSRKNKSCKKVI